MIVVLTICAINCSYFTQGKSCRDGFAFELVGQSPTYMDGFAIQYSWTVSYSIDFVRACILFLKLFSFGYMNKSHVYLFHLL